MQSTVYGANLKADSFSTRDVVDMIIDDIDDPLNNLGGKNQVKGFIKSGGQGQQKGKKKKKKKVQDGGQDGGLYESIRKIKTHDKFENEIDDLLKDTDLTEVVKDKKDDDDVKEIVSEPEDEDGSDEEDQAEHVAQALAQAKDRKKALYSLLEKSSSGATKQVFNFEEEDIGANLNGTLNNQKDALKRDRGRPGKSEKKAMEMELDEEDEDEYGDEEN